MPIPRRCAPLLLLLAVACSDVPGPNAPPATGARSVPADPTLGSRPEAATRGFTRLEAVGDYRFVVPADFNGGIFGTEIGNHVRFVALRTADGEVTGRFHYVQTADGESAIFSGRVTCLAIYDTPVLQRFENIPAMTHNRAKWGGIIEQSNDPTQPPGRYIWFQSIDNGHSHHGGFPDLSTLSGFGDNAANEAFCANPNVPNPNFGPHAVNRGEIVVR
jgi:hypothetical protein